MKTTAAVLVETGKPLEIVELDIPALKEGQVLVEIIASGICHTQVLEIRGHRGEDKFLPHCLGHEGIGLVREVGKGVTKVKPNQRVLLSWMKGSGADINQTIYQWNGRNVNSGAITTFSRYSIISENRLMALPDGGVDNELALFGCAVPTGMGIVFNTADVKAGQTVAVFGVGGIGAAAVMGAIVSGAKAVIAVDVNPDKLPLAKKLGATHTILTRKETTAADWKKEFPGDVDVAIEATGQPSVMRLALEIVRPRGGTVVVAGNARHGSKLELDPQLFNQGKRLLGTWGGENQPDRDFPKYLDLYKQKKLNVSALISQIYDLKDINRAVDDLESGRVVRPIVRMPA